MFPDNSKNRTGSPIYPSLLLSLLSITIPSTGGTTFWISTTLPHTNKRRYHPYPLVVISLLMAHRSMNDIFADLHTLYVYS